MPPQPLPFGAERPPGLPLEWEAWLRRFSKWGDFRSGDRPDLAWLLQSIREGFQTCLPERLAEALNAPPTRVANYVRDPGSDIYRAISEQFIAKELSLGRIVEVPAPGPHKILALSALPKDVERTRWRIITDASAPRGSSTNDLQDPPVVKYPSGDDVNRRINANGRGCYASVVDIQEAYRSCPLHPTEWTVYGYEWEGRYYAETRLCFGAKAAPAYFNAVGLALQEILARDYGIQAVIMYVDDILVVAPTETLCRQRT